MTACALMAPSAPPERTHDEATLDALVATAWEGLRRDRSVTCLICGAEMTPAYGVHARAIGGSCSTCGASLC